MKQPLNRTEWLDIAKGITIILMVLGHTGLPVRLSNFIFAFHMPLFFIASGLVSNYVKGSYKKYVVRKVPGLVVPFTIYSLSLMALLNLSGNARIISVLQHGWGGYALWFVQVLFVASLLVRASYLMERKTVRRICMIGFLVMGYVLNRLDITLPWTMSTVPYAAFLIMMGAECAAYKTRFEASCRPVHIPLLVIITLLPSLFWRLDLCDNEIYPVIPLTIGAFAGTLMIFEISVFVQRRIHLAARILRNIGRETFVVVAFSQGIIITINYFFTMNPLLKYAILIMSLVLITFAKNGINNVIGRKIL